MRKFESAALMRIGISNGDVLERISKLHAFQLMETGEENPSVPWMSKGVIEHALSTMGPQPEKSNKRVASENWGDMDEAD